MRLGVLTDVHSNLEALRVVLAGLKASGAETLFHLGDAIGYGADPNPCCDMLRDVVSLSLLGNHDAAVVDRMDRSWFVSHARAAVEWTELCLSPANRQWLLDAPYVHREGDYLFSHGAPVDPSRYRYVLGWGDADAVFQWMRQADVRVVLVGHAHQCRAFSEDGRVVTVDGIEQSSLDISQGRWVINVGSVGQPRDGDPRACYAVLDLAAGRYEAHRVAYDVAAATEKIYAAGLPAMLGDRLALGR